MSEADNPAGADAGGFDMSGWGWIGDTVEQAVFSQATMAVIRQQSQHDPCGLSAYLREIMIGPEGLSKLADTWAAARTASIFAPLTIRDSIERRGNMPPGSNLTGGKRLAEFALETLGATLLIPPPVLVAMAWTIGPNPPLMALAHMDWIESRMPNGQDIADGSYLGHMSNSGDRISSGVYIKNGVYRGSKIKRLIRRWIDYQVENVSSPGLADVRADLIDLVGTFYGSGEYGFWQEGDPIAPGSKLGYRIYVGDAMMTIEREAQALCDALAVAPAAQASQALAGGLALAAQELENAKLAAEAKQRRDQYMIVAAAMVAALALVQR